MGGKGGGGIVIPNLPPGDAAAPGRWVNNWVNDQLANPTLDQAFTGAPPAASTAAPETATTPATAVPSPDSFADPASPLRAGSQTNTGDVLGNSVLNADTSKSRAQNKLTTTET